MTRIRIRRKKKPEAPPRKKKGRLVIRRKQGRKKKHVLRKIAVLLVIALIGAVCWGVNWGVKTVRRLDSAIDNVERVEIGGSREDLSIAESTWQAQKDSGIVNIALFGKDIEEDGYQRSDSMIVMSVNKNTGDIKLISIQRDTVVTIPGYNDLYKINSAYFFGKDALAVKTINRDLDMDIMDFAAVDMAAMVDIVEALGGVDLNISEEEREQLNIHLVDLNNRLGGDLSPDVTETGLVHCDGRQAMTYARIRSLGNSDFDRTARQRLLLSAIYQKVMEAVHARNIDVLMSLAESMSEHVSTSLTNREILSLAYAVVKGGGSLSMHSLCDESYMKKAYIDGGLEALMPDDLSDMAADLHRIIYGEDFVYVPSEEAEAQAQRIRDYIINYGVELYDIYTGSTIE